jgi:hypothetical protein
MGKPHTIEYVREVIENQGYRLVSTEYKNNHILLDMICPKGHPCKISLANFTNTDRGSIGRRCGLCGRDRRKTTCVNKFGVEEPFASEDVKNKIRQTNIIRFGTENVFQNEEVKRKRTETLIKRLGVEHPTQNKDVQEKTMNTCMDRYGVDRPMKDPEIAERQRKNSHSYKEYIFPSGQKVNVQGYEPFCIDELLELNFSEDDIIIGTSNIPVIDYINIEGKNAKYYPDIYISSRNLLIEVKSSYTLQLHFENNQRKFQAATMQGFDLLLNVFNEKGECIDYKYYLTEVYE